MNVELSEQRHDAATHYFVERHTVYIGRAILICIKLTNRSNHRYNSREHLEQSSTESSIVISHSTPDRVQ